MQDQLSVLVYPIYKGFMPESKSPTMQIQG